MPIIKGKGQSIAPHRGIVYDLRLLHGRTFGLNNPNNRAFLLTQLLTLGATGSAGAFFSQLRYEVPGGAAIGPAYRHHAIIIIDLKVSRSYHNKPYFPGLAKEVLEIQDCQNHLRNGNPMIYARLDDTIDIKANPALFGAKRKPYLVSISSNSKGHLTSFRRDPQGTLSQEKLSYKPFLWLSNLDLIKKLRHLSLETRKLKGNNHYKFLVEADSWSTLRAVSDRLYQESGLPSSHPNSPQLFIGDPITNYLIASGHTYFNKLEFEEPHILFIKTYFQNSSTSLDRLSDPQLSAIALKPGFKANPILISSTDEREILWRLTDQINLYDPDIICGHSLFKLDLEIISKRASALRVKLNWGRASEPIYSRKTRTQVAEKLLEYQRFSISGRELCDLWLLAILHDVSAREMLSFEFVDVANYFHLASGNSQDELYPRASLDLNALAGLYSILAHPYFLQAQMFPLSYEDVMRRGNATRIDHLFLREYYRLDQSIPQKPEAQSFAGGLTSIEHQGCAYGIYHCDVASLYPSLILAHNLSPEKDELNIFKSALLSLRNFRLQAKNNYRMATLEKERQFFGSLQTTFKILINSFYGYLGFAQGHFADYQKAAEVTLQGRELLTKMIASLKAMGAKILEVDTDGVYFVPSRRLLHNQWLEALNKEFPQEVNIEFDGRYRAMYCHKMKNYALLEDDGSLILRGSGLRSRATEPYLRAFLEDLIKQALTSGLGEEDAIFLDYEHRLKAGAFSVQELAKTETLIDSPSAYARKISTSSRNRAAVYEIALNSSNDYRAGDSISYYVSGDKATVTVYDHCRPIESFNPDWPDINWKYYIKKLKEAYKKFLPILQKEPIYCEVAYQELPAPA